MDAHGQLLRSLIGTNSYQISIRRTFKFLEDVGLGPGLLKKSYSLDIMAHTQFIAITWLSRKQGFVGHKEVKNMVYLLWDVKLLFTVRERHLLVDDRDMPTQW